MVFTEGLNIPYPLIHGGMHYEVVLRIRTSTDPRGMLFDIQQRINDAVHVLSMDYHLIEDRPTTDEHHGGITDDDDT